jgi:hypothetical protein
VDGKTVVKETKITRAQADEIIRARAEHRPIEKTIGSTDPAICASWNWTLVTSESNGAGSIFCATNDGSDSMTMIPFVPRWISFSVNYDTKLCWNTSACTSTCTSVGSGVWGRWHPRPDMNISPPSSVRYLDVYPMQFC